MSVSILYFFLSLLCFIASLGAFTYFLRWFHRNAIIEPLPDSERERGLIGILFTPVFAVLGIYLALQSSLINLIPVKTDMVIFLPILAMQYVAGWNYVYREWHFPSLSVNRNMSGYMPFLGASVTLHALLYLPIFLFFRPETTWQLLDKAFLVHLVVLVILACWQQTFCPPLRPVVGIEATRYRNAFGVAIFRYATGLAFSYTAVWLGLSYPNALPKSINPQDLSGVMAMMFIVFLSSLFEVWARSCWKPFQAANPASNAPVIPPLAKY